MIGKILVAIDGSELADKALDLALDQAEKYSAEVVLITVVAPLVIPAAVEPITGEPIVSPQAVVEVEEVAEASHREMLSEALKKSKKMRPGVKVSTKLTKGRVADSILETARQGKFDMIVMGSHGMSGFREFLLGSVSNQVVHNAPCPVLIVK